MNKGLLLSLLVVALVCSVAYTSAQTCQPLNRRPSLDGPSFTAFVRVGYTKFLPLRFKNKMDLYDHEPKDGLYHGNSTITTDCATIESSVTKDLAGKESTYHFEKMTYNVQGKTESCKLQFDGPDGDGTKYSCTKSLGVRAATISEDVASLTIGKFNFDI